MLKGTTIKVERRTFFIFGDKITTGLNFVISGDSKFLKSQRTIVPGYGGNFKAIFYPH